MVTVYEKIDSFMHKTGNSFSAQTLSRRLKLNEKTTDKTLRRLLKDGQLTRQWTKTKNGHCYRYRAV